MELQNGFYGILKGLKFLFLKAKMFSLSGQQILRVNIKNFHVVTLVIAKYITSFC